MSGMNVLKKLFPQGELSLGQTGSTNYFYTLDHLRSVCEAMNANGILATRYSYDPFGQKSVTQENLLTTFAFTGDFVHSRSGYYLTKYRPLDSAVGRWLSRDPSGESAGLNLYAYVKNDSLNQTDPLGLDAASRQRCLESCNRGCLILDLGCAFFHPFCELYLHCVEECPEKCQEPPPPNPPCTGECTCGR